MPQIPLYEQQARISAEQAGVQYDASAEIEGLREDARTGEIIADFGVEFQDKYDRLKSEAAEADYELRLKQFKTDLVDAKAEAMQKGIHYADIEQSVVQPAINDFRNQIGRMGYGKSTTNFQQRFALEEQDLIAGERLDRLKLQTNEHITSIKDQAFSLMLGNDEQYQQGTDQINNLQSSGYITAEQRDDFLDTGTSAMLKSKISNIADTEELQKIKESEKYLSLTAVAKAEIDGEIANRISKVGSEVVSVEMKALNKARDAGNLTPDAIRAAQVPEEIKQTYLDELDLERQLEVAEYNLDPAIDLDQLGKRVNNYFLGEYKGDSRKEFLSIWQEINDPDNGIPKLERDRLNDLLIDTMANPDMNLPMFMDSPFKTALLPELQNAFAQLAREYDEATASLPPSLAGAQFIDAYTQLWDYAVRGQKQLELAADLPSRTGRGRIVGAIAQANQKEKYGEIDLSPEGINLQINRILSPIRKRYASFIVNKTLGVYETGALTDHEVGQEVNEALQITQ